MTEQQRSAGVDDVATAPVTAPVVTQPTPEPPTRTANEALAVSIAAAVERRLTRYVATMVQQVEATRNAGETARAELHNEFSQQIADLAGRIESQRSTTESYQRALQNALEERLAEFANHQHVRLNELDARFAEVTPAGDITEKVTAQVTTVTQGLRDYVENQTTALDARLNELHRNSNRFDEQANALVHHVNETTQALATRIDQGDQRVTQEIEKRLGDVAGMTDGVRNELEAQLAESRTMSNQRIDSTDMKFTDRMVALEGRLNDTHGTKVATLEASIGRLGAGIDEAMVSLSQRSAELKDHICLVESRLDELSTRMASIDADALDGMKEQLSAAIGEAMLVRIEVERVVASTDEKLDKSAMRMAEIEAMFTDEMDVGAAVQLERLDEIERALVALDPNQFVRKVDPAVGYTPAPTGDAPGDIAGNGTYGNYDMHDMHDTGSTPVVEPVPQATFVPRLPGTSPGPIPTPTSEPSHSS